MTRTETHEARNNELAATLNHIETLRKHGAQVLSADGKRTELNRFFLDKAMDACASGNCIAICYELFLPGIDNKMLIAVHSDGRVDTGSEESIMKVLDR